MAKDGTRLTDSVPAERVRAANRAPPSAGGDFVLYWMTAFRRTGWNFSLQRAVAWARRLRKPLAVVETLGCGNRWDSDRHHRFVLEGMAENAARFAGGPALYYPYVETAPGRGAALLAALAARACVVVADDFPGVNDADARAGPAVLVEKIDGNGLLPLRATDRVFTTAASFRRFLQNSLRDHLLAMPQANPLARADLPPMKPLPAGIVRRWPAATPRMLAGDAASLTRLPINHGVAPVATAGGPRAAAVCLRQFLHRRLAAYHALRNHPDDEATSGLSPYLHFGPIGVHEVFHALARQEQWTPGNLAAKAQGRREGWWGMSPAAEAFLDELVTWREIGFHAAAKLAGYDRYESLPDWARATLRKHARDRRERTYALAEFEAAATHDPLWNAAQRELLCRGRIHNYLRMLWAKKILQWSPTPEHALATMIELNNKYALDGRDPNSISGIFWVLGRYDRPWGPERPVFGVVRYMSSANTQRKLRIKKYLEMLTPRSPAPYSA